MDELGLWLDSPLPKAARYEMAGIVAFAETFSRVLNLSARGAKLTDAEPPIDHLMRLRWLESYGEGGSATLRITRLGQALLLGAERAVEAEPVLSVVVLGAEDPLAYPSLMGRLAGINDGLLVDPFLGVEQLHELIRSTRISRILVSNKQSATTKRVAMATYLTSGSVARSVDVRAASGLHDRLVLSDLESFTLGTSLNSVGRTTTVLSPLPAAAAAALSTEFETVWADAEPLVAASALGAGPPAAPIKSVAP